MCSTNVTHISVITFYVTSPSVDFVNDIVIAFLMVKNNREIILTRTVPVLLLLTTWSAQQCFLNGSRLEMMLLKMPDMGKDIQRHKQHAECPFWDQALLNNTKLKLINNIHPCKSPNQTQCIRTVGLMTWCFAFFSNLINYGNNSAFSFEDNFCWFSWHIATV